MFEYFAVLRVAASSAADPASRVAAATYYYYYYAAFNAPRVGHKEAESFKLPVLGNSRYLPVLF